MADEQTSSAAAAPLPEKKPAIIVPGQGRPRFIGQKIIKARFQFKFAFSILVFLGIAAAVVWLQGRMAVSNMIASGAVTDPGAVDQLRLLNSIVGRTIVLGLAITFGLALFFSHFIAGPLFRFEKTLEEMRNGNLAINVKLRKNDELKDVADAFNQALAGLRSKVKIERDAVSASLLKVKTVAAALKKEGRTQEAAQIEAAIQEFESRPPQIRI